MSSASSSSTAVFRRFFLPPSTSLNKSFTGNPTLRPISRPFPILESKSPKNTLKYVEPVATSFHKFSILCSRNEHSSSEPPKPDEGISRHLPEELKFSHSSAPKRDSDSTPQKKSANTVLAIFGEKWDVPWAAGTILQVMLLCAAVFWFTGSGVYFYAADIAGLNLESLRGQALYSLVAHVSDGLAALAILWLCLSRYRPLPPDWFRFSVKGKWHLDVMLVCLMFPLVKELSRFKLELPPLSGPLSFSCLKRSVRTRDPVAMALYAIENSICAPVWEEIVFRGFLLPSLTKYMPVWCAVLVSSIAFALGHYFNLPNIIPITSISFMIGVTFNRSRNLLPPMLLHGLWNSFLFLCCLKSSISAKD